MTWRAHPAVTATKAATKAATVLAMAVLLAGLAGGCKQYARATFEVTVLNRTQEHLSVGLMKNGPPLEEEWAAPHEVAIGAPELADRKWGRLAKPGQTVVLGPLEGRFDVGVSAVLRAYSGDAPIGQLIAYPGDSPDRAEAYLNPGRSTYVVHRRLNGRLAIDPVDPTDPAEHHAPR